MKPTPEQVERAATALYPFVTHWHLPLNPEDLDELAFAVLTHFDSDRSLQEIHDAAETKVGEHAAWSRREQQAYARGARRVDGFYLQCRSKILARLEVQTAEETRYICSFEPTLYFSEFRELFEEQRLAVAAGDRVLIDEATRAIETAGITLWPFGEAGPTADFLLEFSGSEVTVKYRADPGFAQLDETRPSTGRSVTVTTVTRDHPRTAHDMSELLLVRLASVAGAYGLPETRDLRADTGPLDRDRSRVLQRELAVLEEVSSDPPLRTHITTLRKLANTVAGGGPAAELHVEPRDT